MTKRLTSLDPEASESASRREPCGAVRNALRFLSGQKDHLPPKWHYLWTVILIGLWYMFAIVGTIASKSFMKWLPKPTTLAGGQMAVGAFLDFLLLLGCGLENQIDSRVLWSAFPVGVTLTMGRFLTYFSYQTVAASLTHTVKASSPVFTVALLFLFYGKCQPMWTLLSLVPIILGVILSAVTEMEIKADGFAAAVAAGLISTVQALYAKSSLKNSHHPMVFHMCSCLWAAVLLIPSSLILEGQPMELIDSIHDLSDRQGAGTINKVLFASFVCYWGQNLTSILVLSQMHVLSHQVANVSRRFALIISTMVYFGNTITVSKLIGILMALSGFFWFSFSKKLKVSKTNKIQENGVKIGRPELSDPSARHSDEVHDVEMASMPKKI
uniref:Sugar phosphate transporter domain-containing protein n=1 Tax=Lotharella oceanica TaxID=641309 RepID=A0A7S2TNW3_9EUKA